MKKARALQKDLSNELLKLEKTQQQQAENDALLKELNNQVVEVKKEIDNSNDRITKLRAEAQQLDEEQSELQKAISNREAEEKARLVPEIERCQQRIADMHAEIAKNEEAIENENGKSATLQEKIAELEKVKDEKKEAYEQL